MITETQESFKEIPIPEQIIKYIKKQNGIYEFSKNESFSVTDLISCTRNSFFKKTRMSKDNQIQNISELWPSVRGNLLHSIGQAYSWNELEGSIDILVDNQKKIKICGRLDMYDNNTKTILDLKTINDVKLSIKQKTIPTNEHIIQVQAYYTIFSKSIPIKHLNLMYVDSNNMINYEIPIKDVTDWIIQRSKNLSNSITEFEIPNGEVSTKCRFCKYQKTCLEKGDGINFENYKNQKFE